LEKINELINQAIGYLADFFVKSHLPQKRIIIHNIPKRIIVHISKEIPQPQKFQIFPQNQPPHPPTLIITSVP